MQARVCQGRQYQTETNRCDTFPTRIYSLTSYEITILLNNYTNMGVLMVNYDE
jgi:hypothetical protein